MATNQNVLKINAVRTPGPRPRRAIVSGTIKGNRVHLTASARVNGDIIHNSIAIESGAHFEGSIEKSEDPLTKPIPKGAATIS